MCVLQALHKDTLGKVVCYNEYDIEHVYVLKFIYVCVCESNCVDLCGLCGL